MPDDYEREAETGMPFVMGAQRPLACTHMIEDDTGEVVTETLVLPNFIFFLHNIDGVRVGRGIMASPQYAARFVEELPRIIDHVNGCDCHMHDGRSMDFVPCE